MAEAASEFQQLRDRYGWLDHLVRAGARYTERHGNDYGAAVTYFSVLSLVPGDDGRVRGGRFRAGCPARGWSNA